MKIKGYPLLAITDGTSNTLMVTEAATPVLWTTPDGLPFNPSVTMFGMGSRHPGGPGVLVGGELVEHGELRRRVGIVQHVPGREFFAMADQNLQPKTF